VVTWSSDNTAVATVNGSGLVTGVAAGGPVTITATSEGQSGTAAVTVTTTGAPVASVTVTPGTVTVAVGSSVQLTATTKDAAGNVLTGRTITWSASNGNVTVSATGLVTGQSGGHVTVTATSEGVSGSASVFIGTVTVPVATVTVSPATATIGNGGSVQLSATLKDSLGNTLTGRTVTWASSNTAAATVNGSGLVTGVAVGTATITATSEGKSGTASITVITVPVASVTVTPSPASVQQGFTVQLTATPRDANGNPLSGRTVSWSSSNTAAATVNGSGLVTGVAVGSATITATSEGQNGTAAITVTPPSASGVLVGAGDIADCDAQPTATLLDNIPGTVFTAGDNAYPNGSASDYANCYDPSWGRHKARTHPSPGNHDYNTSTATGYYNYFGALAGPPGVGYYSYDLGAWHIVSLNSNISMSAGSAQETWLRADLAASTKRCTIAYWHHPRFSSGSHHGSSTQSAGVFQALYDAGAEIVIVGHDHEYERFAPQTPTAAADPVRGIREFVVGTGGAGLYSFGTPLPNSEVRDNTSHGVLKLTLSDGLYSWEFIPVAGNSFTDSGSGTCH
jgi:acid phosphatase type 7